MQASLTIPQVAAAVSGWLQGPCDGAGRLVTGMTWDSRAVREGSAFVGFPGERVDGNDFAEQAMRSGAACVLMTRDADEAQLSASAQTGCPVVRIEDGTGAITALARAWRAIIDPVCVAVTGSNGKTTTKDLLACVLEPLGQVTATKKNQNNELGIPATVLAADERTKVLVVEIGMRGRHQIDTACDELVHPSIGVITNVGTSHMELLGSRENIALAKGELVCSLPDDGLAVLPGQDDYFDLLKDLAGKDREKPVAVLSYGDDPACDVWADEVHVGPLGTPTFILHLPDGASAPVALPLMGGHNVRNALAAAAVAWHLGLDAATIAERLGLAGGTAGRTQVREGRGGVRVIDDAYNANPDSMRAGLAALMALESDGRRVAVLGDMGELGPTEAELHREVGAAAAAAGVDQLVCIGTLARQIAAGACDAGMPKAAVSTCDTVDEALALLRGGLASGDVVLVKASHSMGLTKVVEGLVD